ncbi:lysophospholipid acyltransferase family protein [Solimonas marina]|uniref:Glycerol acyltransferase n=1 Tax=Solimonas marina TaxID=2714601 RepID=A0A970B6Y8_9GAMM|nr:lysophospholipid acyltransferase family protein [Solimonas marina]NKF23318.1 glycerol acyltransferase [Solimonas marina]
MDREDRIAIGAHVPRRQRPLLRRLGRAVLRSFGWRLQVTVPDVPKLVVIAAPHTSNWDFVFGMAAVLALDLDVHWLGKHTLFRGIWGRPLRALGGIAVDRQAAGGVVRQSSDAFVAHEQLIIALAPEGTRSRVARWKRGFYHIATAADVPVLVAYIDYRTRTVGANLLVWPTGDWDRDMRPVFAFYDGVTPKRPADFATEPPLPAPSRATATARR